MQKRVLLVHWGGGAPLEYALPRIAARAEVHILALRPLPAKTEGLWRPHCAAVIPAPGHLQRKVESVARGAVDALGLQTCGTHTEIKLMDNGELSVIESAARLGGAMIAGQVEHAFGYEPIGMLVDGLLGLPARFPERMLTDRDAGGAAASLSLIATDAAGVPWAKDLVWDENLVDWTGMVTAGSRISAVPGATIANGTPMPRYDLSSGILALGGILFLRAANADIFVRDSLAVLNGLESALARGWADKSELLDAVQR